MPRWLLPLYDHDHELHQCSSLFSQAQTVLSDSSSVLTDSTPELTTGINMIKSGKGKVDGDLETENSIHVLDFRDGTIHFFTNYNLDYFIRRCKPIPYFIPRIKRTQV